MSKDDTEGREDKNQRPKVSVVRRIGDAARATGHALIHEVPGLKTFAKAFEQTETLTRRRRQNEWLAWIVDGDLDREAFANAVAAELASQEGDLCRAAVLDSARSAIDAVDDAVIPSIGLLTRRWLRVRDFELRTFRAILRMFREFEREEFEALRVAVHHLSTQGSRVFQTMLRTQHPDGVVWIVLDDDQEFRVLIRGPLAIRVVRAIAPLAAEHHTSMLAEHSILKPEFSLELIRLLNDIMPLND